MLFCQVLINYILFSSKYYIFFQTNRLTTDVEVCSFYCFSSIRKWRQAILFVLHWESRYDFYCVSVSSFKLVNSSNNRTVLEHDRGLQSKGLVQILTACLHSSWYFLVYSVDILIDIVDINHGSHFGPSSNWCNLWLKKSHLTFTICVLCLENVYLPCRKLLFFIFLIDYVPKNKERISVGLHLRRTTWVTLTLPTYYERIFTINEQKLISSIF